MKKQKIFFRSPTWAALLSALVVPGLGQIYNGELPKGLLLITSSLGSFFWFSKVVTERLTTLLPGAPDQWVKNQETLKGAVLKLIDQDPDMFLTFQTLIILVWIFGVIDAYLTARKPPTVSLPSDDETHPFH